MLLGLYWDNGKEHGSYYNGLYRGKVYGSYWEMEKKMETTIPASAEHYNHDDYNNNSSTLASLGCGILPFSRISA